jgi:hypothetical protein
MIGRVIRFDPPDLEFLDDLLATAIKFWGKEAESAVWPLTGVAHREAIRRAVLIRNKLGVQKVKPPLAVVPAADKPAS